TAPFVITREGPSMTQITTIGLDLAKKVFQVHGVDAEGKVVVAQKLRRKEVLAFFAKLAPCLDRALQQPTRVSSFPQSARSTTVTAPEAMVNSAELGPQTQAERRSMKASVARAHSTGWLAAA